MKKDGPNYFGDKAQGGPSASGADVGEFDPHIPD